MNELVWSDTWLPLSRATEPKKVSVELSQQLMELIEPFDYKSDGQTEFLPYEIPDLPKDFGIGLIVGASGSGKSTLLAEFGEADNHEWTAQAIGDHFETAQEASERFYAVGLGSIPTWLKPYAVLSNGEKFRADLARSLKDNSVIDEFTSVVDRNVALAASKTFRRYVTDKGLKGIVIASCHRDIIPYLKPDWIIDTDAGQYVIEPRECLRQSPMVAQVFEADRAAWDYFAPHHYLTSELSPFARCFISVIGDEPAAFVAAISYPSGTVRDAYRASRLVTLPDFQGLGLGPRMADFIAEAYVSLGKRYFAKTAHPRLGEYRERSPRWKPTSKNKKYRTDVISDSERQKRRNRFTAWTMNADRFVYSHEYIGDKIEEAAER
jgi:ABC-type ATPase involved in cell division